MGSTQGRKGKGRSIVARSRTAGMLMPASAALVATPSPRGLLLISVTIVIGVGGWGCFSVLLLLSAAATVICASCRRGVVAAIFSVCIFGTDGSIGCLSLALGFGIISEQVCHISLSAVVPFDKSHGVIQEVIFIIISFIAIFICNSLINSIKHTCNRLTQGWGIQIPIIQIFKSAR